MDKSPKPTFINYTPKQFSPQETQAQAEAFYSFANNRRSVRHFSDEPVAQSVIEKIIETASTAPSGAHKQPWTFCAISNADIKKQIREAAEQEEYQNYHGRMSQEWLTDLELFETTWQKPFLETVPWIIVVFKKVNDLDQEGNKTKNYYVNESVGLATGFLLLAIHNAGLCSLTHTPSPMNFLTKLLNRPSHEKPFLLIPVGYAAHNCQVPQLERKNLSDISVFYS